MGVKKVDLVPARKLPQDIREKYKIREGEYAEMRVINADEGIVVRKVRSPVVEIRKVLRKNNINIRL